jgi:hypothetical protein
VAISHNDTLWDASFASSSGSVKLDMPGASNDSCLVVITGQNKVPVMKTIYFSRIKKEFVNLSASSINDSGGNNNTLADYGEPIFLKLTLGNLGQTNATNLYAKISSTTDLATITRDSVFIGTLAAGTETILDNKLALKISDNVPDMGIVTVRLTLRDQLSEKHYNIDIAVHAPELQILSCMLDDQGTGNGDNIPDPGETFKLVFKVQNQGSSDISGLFSISNTNNNLTIVDPDIKSGTLKFGQVTDIQLLVKLSETIPSGSLVSLSALLDCKPYIVNKDFNFRVGKIRESFEALSFKVFPWINTGSAPWVITSSTSADGVTSARSGTIGHNASSSLSIRTYYSADDSVRFYFKVSSEPIYDILSFRLNGVEMFRKSGEIPWTTMAFPVQAGYNKMEWIYKKDNTVSQGSDCAWIDMIDFARTSPVGYIQRDLQVAKLVPPKNDQIGIEAITAKVLNPGRDTINGFNLAYQINGHLPLVVQHFSNKLIPQADTMLVTFDSEADLSKYGVYKISVFGVQNNDDYLPNDTASMRLENVKITETVGVFPNPFTNKLTIYINSPVPEKLSIALCNVSGVKLYDLERSIISGNNSITLTDLNLAPALYYLNIRGVSVNKTVPVLKTK